MKTTISLYAVLFCLDMSCGRAPVKAPGFSSVSVSLFPSGSKAPVKSDTAGVVTASFDSNSTVTQLITGSASGNLSQVAVAVAPGSLAISTEISLRETSSMGTETFVKNLGTPALVLSSGAAVSVASSQAIDLLKPMVLALPLPVSLNLSAASSNANLGVLYRVSVQATGQHLVGFIPASELSYDSANRLLYPTLHFGSFQVVSFDQQVSKTEAVDAVPTNDGIMYVLAGETLPSCGAADVGKTIYTQATSQFQVCGATGWTVVDLKGAKGDAGQSAPTGTSNPLSVFDATGKNLGVFAGSNLGDSYYVRFNDGVTVRLTPEGGFDQTGFGQFQCQYASTDCSGTCLVDGQASLVNEFLNVKGKDIGGPGVNTMTTKTLSFGPGTVTPTASSWNSYTNSCDTVSGNVTNVKNFVPYTLPYTSYVLPLTVRIP